MGSVASTDLVKGEIGIGYHGRHGIRPGRSKVDKDVLQQPIDQAHRRVSPHGDSVG